jgi:hypothetical protein
MDFSTDVPASKSLGLKNILKNGGEAEFLDFRISILKTMEKLETVFAQISRNYMAFISF